MAVNEFPQAPTGEVSPDPIAIIRFVRAVATVVNRIMRGKINCVGEVTLDANAASTVVTDQRMTVNSVVVFDPLTANAAAELYGATMYVTPANRRNGTFTVTHANNAQTDRSFKYAIVG